MERFPRGSYPHSAYTGSVREAPTPVASPPSTIDPGQGAAPAAHSPRGVCDLEMTCPNCNTLMQPEHAHYRCATCGYRDSCCF
jgi:hypothetical protein